MNFIEKILTGIGNIGTFVGDLIGELVSFLAKPLALLLSFLEGIFYFITKFFTVVVEIIMLFVAMFQYLFAIISGLFRTLSAWIGFSPSGAYNLPMTSRQGFNTALDQVGGTGLTHIMPMIIIAVLWIYFAFKVIRTLGDKGDIQA